MWERPVVVGEEEGKEDLEMGRRVNMGGGRAEKYLGRVGRTGGSSEDPG